MEGRPDYREHERRKLPVSMDMVPEPDPLEVEALSRRLRTELLRLDVESVIRLPGPPAPERAKAGDPVSWSDERQRLIDAFVAQHDRQPG